MLYVIGGLTIRPLSYTIILIHSTLRVARWTPTSSSGASRTPRAALPWTVRHVTEAETTAWSNRAHFKFIYTQNKCTAAHKDGVTVLGWLGEQELVSSGNDAVIVLWDLAKCKL